MMVSVDSLIRTVVCYGLSSDWIHLLIMILHLWGRVLTLGVPLYDTIMFGNIIDEQSARVLLD